MLPNAVKVSSARVLVDCVPKQEGSQFLPTMLPQVRSLLQCTMKQENRPHRLHVSPLPFIRFESD
jgi:hypothetical protein